MIEAKEIAGVLNLDDPQEVVPKIHHVGAKNVTFRGNGANMRVQNKVGNRQIPNTLPIDTNVTIGHHYDQVKGRLFFFNWNSENHHGIYIYTLSTQTIQILIVNASSAAAGDAISFSITKPIIGTGIIYGDSLQGDILYFLDSNGKPCKINIDRALSGGYGFIQRTYLEVAKEPPSIPPQVIYEDDPNVTVNNLRKKLFVPMARFWFDDNDKSTWSQHGELPLPLNPFDKTIDQDPTKNADIAIVVQTGKPNVKKIEIAMAVSLGNVFSDFFSVVVLDKALMGIPDNDIYLFRFYNDKAYNNVETNTVAELNESILLYDLVPISAVAQEILNGNTLIYANITEGYPNVTNLTNGTAPTSVVTSQENVNRTNAFSLFFVAQGGETIGNGGTIHFIVAGKIAAGDTYEAFFDSANVLYTAIGGDTTASVINGLATNATGLGFTVVNIDANNLFVTKTNTNLLRFVTTKSTSLNVSNSSYAAYDWSSKIDFGLNYFDEKGRIPGVATNVTMSAASIKYTESGGIEQIPAYSGSITHRPPIQATHYCWMRTKDTTKSKFVQWISDRTYKDVSTSSTDVLYAYISIENLNTFVSLNPNSPLTYQFSANDRIRFMKLYNNDLNNPIYPADKDFEIDSQIIDPIINGVQQTGQFIKIVLPVTDTTFDFGVQTHSPFPNPLKYNNYFIELYSPAQSVANGLDFYYEFSERYAIINAGTANRCHQGQLQNQSTDLTTPATFLFDKGEAFYKTRTINTGVELIYQIAGGFGPDSNAGRITLGCALQSESYNDPNIKTGNSPYQNLIDFHLDSNNDRWIIEIVSGTYQFRIKGTIIITFSDDRPDDSYQFALQKNTGVSYILVQPFDSSKAGTYTFPIDTTFTMNSGEKIFIFGISLPNFDHTRSFTSTTLTITSQQFFTQGMIDPNFSDLYQSAVNSNGRANVINPNAAQVSFPTLLRWGQSYQIDTNINQSNRFYTTTFDEVDRGKGSIQKLKVRDRILRGFQERYCFQMGIYAKFIQDSKGTNTLTTTDDIITTNNVQYYEGEYGVGLHPESIVHGKIQDYFKDYIRGYDCRLSGDGIIPISELYKGQYSIRNLITPYNQVWARPDGSVAKILGCYDFFEEEYVSYLQGGVNNGFTMGPNTYGFNEKRNAYSSFYDYAPDWLASAEDTVYSWLNGQLWVHDNQTAYSTYYNANYPSTITFVFNDKIATKKVFNAITYQGNQIWTSELTGDILTSMINPQTNLQQQSQLKSVDYEIQENIRYAALLRDANSMQNANIALLEGDFLTGQWLQITFKYEGSNFAWLYAPYLNFQQSPRNF